MQCKDFEQVIEQSGLVHLPEAAEAHAAGCPACTALVEDFASIVAAASQIPAELDPPARVWVAIEAQLNAEGIIRQPRTFHPAERAPWWQGLGRLSRGRMWATAAVTALVLVAGVYQMRRERQGVPIPETAVTLPFAETDSTLNQEEQSLGPIETVSTLGGTSNVDAALRENLGTVNAFIKECQKRLKEEPNDPMAREYLSTAYQQKAEILAAMMERGRSVN